MKLFIIILFSLSFMVNAELKEADYRILFTAIAKVESSLLPNQVNQDEDARGYVQIRGAYLSEANEYLGTNYTHDDCHRLDVSYKLFKAYLKMHKAWSLEDAARLHNSGPKRYLEYKQRATDKYWAKVKAHLML